jgi:hypothetical protein
MNNSQQYPADAYGYQNPQALPIEHQGDGSNFLGLKIFGIGSKKTTKDGKEMKKRGPKPDATLPATRRQAMNRQAQRTHREKKEMKMRALEEAAAHYEQRLIEHQRREKEHLRRIEQLVALLVRHNIAIPAPGEDPVVKSVPIEALVNPYTSPTSLSASSFNAHSQGISPHGSQSHSLSPGVSNQGQRMTAVDGPLPNIDYRDVGAQFVWGYDSNGQRVPLPPSTQSAANDRAARAYVSPPPQ